MQTTSADTLKVTKVAKDATISAFSVEQTERIDPINLSTVPVKKRKLSMLHLNDPSGQMDVTDGEDFIISWIRAMVASETDDAVYSDLQAWQLLKFYVEEVLVGNTPDPGELEDTPLLYIAAYATAEWMRCYRTITSERLQKEEEEEIK